MIDAVAIGASSGGMTALGILLPCLPVQFNCPSLSFSIPTRGQMIFYRGI